MACKFVVIDDKAHVDQTEWMGRSIGFNWTANQYGWNRLFGQLTQVALQLRLKLTRLK